MAEPDLKLEWDVVSMHRPMGKQRNHSVYEMACKVMALLVFRAAISSIVSRLRDLPRKEMNKLSYMIYQATLL